MDCVYGETRIKINNLTVQYGKKLILKNVNAEIKKITGHGQVVSLLGPSGIGKTTLLRVMSGLEKPTSGSVMIHCDGTKEESIPVKRGLVGVVSQNYPLFRHHTVMGNLLIAAGMKNHKSREERKQAALEMLEKFGISEQADKYMKEISGGQRQRVAIAQQLLCSEHFILMDEPFSGLDPIAKMNVCRFVQEVGDMDELNTIIIVTHGIEEAIMVSDEIWMIGRDKEGDKFLPGAYIKKIYSLIEMDLAWHPNIYLTSAFSDFVKRIKVEFNEL